MHHLEIEQNEAWKDRLAADLREETMRIRRERQQQIADSLRRQEPVVDDYNAPTNHANQQATEFERTAKESSTVADTVNHPAHYTQGGIECIEVLEQLAADGHDFRILNAMKYLWRYRHKGGHESLRKAVWYIQRVVEDE